MGIFSWARIGLSTVLVLLTCAASARAQRPRETETERNAREARHAAGVRVGNWDVDEPNAEARFMSSLQFEVSLQRGLDEHLVLENSAGVWRRVTHARQQLPTGSDTVVTKAYLIPLMTSLKLFPVTLPSNLIEPYVAGGVGFALGVEDESQNAIGGGGTSIVTGFCVRAAAGVSIRVRRAVGATVAGRYQWLKLSEEIGLEDTFEGPGIEGGLTFRFSF